MIKFFNNIRRKQLTENRFSKYLLYAIGEIFLVVVGILIALQINNWNELKKEHQLETRILNEILSNMESDLENLDAKIADTERFIFHNTRVLKHLDNDLPISDSLRFSYSMLYGAGIFHPNTIGYDNLKSIGIDIIRNEHLRNQISELYSFKYFRFDEEIQRVVKTFQDKLVDEIYKNIKEIIPLRLAEPINIDELRHNHQFKNAVLINITVLEGVNRRYNQGIKEIELVAQSIRDELNK